MTRILISAVVSCALSGLLGYLLLPVLRALKAGQSIREIGPTWHNYKAGTPMMGGLMFIFAAIICLLLNIPFMQDYTVFFVLALSLCFGFVGFVDDFCHFVICVGRGRGFLGGDHAAGGELTVVKHLIQDHAGGIGIHGVIQGRICVADLGSGPAATAAVGQGSVLQRVQPYKAQIANVIFLLTGKENVIGLQIHIEISGLAAGSQRGADLIALRGDLGIGRSCGGVSQEEKSEGSG